MTKNLYKIVLGCILLSLSSCFKDMGNYQYEELKPPTWLISVQDQLIYVWAKGGNNVTLDAASQFKWKDGEAEKRNQEVTYRWVVNGKTISTQVTETLKTEELMKRIGLKDYPVEPLIGNFIITEKKTGVEFKARTYIQFFPPIAEGDFIVYTAKKGTPSEGVLSSLSLTYKKDESGSLKENFLLKPNVSETIIGTPKSLTIAIAKNVSPTGSVTAITEEGSAIVFNASTLKKAWDIKEQFMDGNAPSDLRVSAIQYQETSANEPSFTWLATKDGKIYTRQKGKYFLGGKFLNEPYFLDQNEYKITSFGHTLWGITNIPCYDEKNRRIVMATCLPHNETNTYRAFISVLSSPSYRGVPIQKMEEGAEVFHISNVISGLGWFGDRNSTWYAVYYNSPQFGSVMGKFAVSNRSRQLMTAFNGSHYKIIKGHKFSKETVFLTSACTRYTRNFFPTTYDLFSEGNKIIAIIKSSNMQDASIQVKELPFEGITSKITSMTYDRSGDKTYPHLLVGCENGDLHVFNVTTLPEPKLVKTFHLDGRVASIKQLGIMRLTMDLY